LPIRESLLKVGYRIYNSKKNDKMTLKKISSDLATQSPGYVDFLLWTWFVFNCGLFEKWSVM